MTRILRLFACLILLTGTVVTAETLTNDSVIQMHKLGLGDPVVVEKIKSSTCQFDTSLDALKSLKDAGLSDEIIQAMIAASKPVVPAAPAAPAVAPPADPNDPKAAHESGIYLYQEVDGKPKMTKMTPSRVEEIKSGGGWTVGFGGTMKTRAVLDGPHASVQITESQPVFYFYFDSKEQGLGSMNVSATTPEDFALGAMELHKTHDVLVRRIEISKASIGGYHAGLSKTAVQPFTSEKLSDGVFKVTPSTLKPGEYVFVQVLAGHVAGYLKMFDFGIEGGGK